MKKSKTREELLINTCKFYNSENRGIDKLYDCRYMTDEKKRCSIGREVSTNKAVELEREGGTVRHVFSLLPKRLQSMGEDFLLSIQQLHDSGLNWTKDGLSYAGVEKVMGLIREYKLNVTKEDLT